MSKLKKIKQLVVHNKIFKTSLNWWERILDFIFFNKVSCFFRHSYRFIKRLPNYIKLAWDQETWDYEYLYDLIEMKLKELLKAQEEDTWHVGKETKRRAKQIRICLAYLDRFRNWTEYYDYPTDDLRFKPIGNGCSKMVHDDTYNELRRKGVDSYIKFNYDMFWKRFLQWHQGWWT